ncbi:MAG: F-type H+-transporting ATPase subunit alpha, partial [Sulfitobacter sp.]
QFPAVDLGVSVSRVGGKAQSRAFRSVAGNLRVTLSQFEELEDFARFGTRLDDATRARLTRGAAVRASLRQAERDPIPAVEQLAVLVAAMDGQFDGLNEADIFAVMGAIRVAAARDLGDIAEQIAQNEPFEDAARTRMITLGQQARATLKDADGTIA